MHHQQNAAHVRQINNDNKPSENITETKFVFGNSSKN